MSRLPPATIIPPAPVMHRAKLPPARPARHGLWAFALAAAANCCAADVSPLDLMPRTEDHTRMAWADGFPAKVSGAPWHRLVRTGRYGFVLDTETLRIPHFGPLAPSSYEPSEAGDESWRKLPGATLDLAISTNGKTFHCTGAGPWTRFGGPRLIESGRFVQRADVTGLAFQATDGTTLNTEARLETVAWPDRLALILSARPGLQTLPPGDRCFGRLGGGFGLDGSNHLEIPHAPEIEQPAFTLEVWVYPPADYAGATKAFPWIVCKQAHEEADGNIGLVIVNGKAEARLNIGGGKANSFRVTAGSPLRVEAWNHFAISYDGTTLRLHQNGEAQGERAIGRPFVPRHGNITLGRRQDNCGDGFHFRGCVDEIRLHPRALTDAEIRACFAKPETTPPASQPVRQWTFRDDIPAAATRPAESWRAPRLLLTLATPQTTLRQNHDTPPPPSWNGPGFIEAALTINPATMHPPAAVNAPTVHARDKASGRACPVTHDPVRGWTHVNLDDVEPVLPAKGTAEPRNDALERVALVLTNDSDTACQARLLFGKSAGGLRHRVGSPITGVSAVLRFPDGQPSGIPVQLSKNWHAHPQGGVHSGAWFHGFSQVRLPPHSTVELELALACSHWGGIPAASHAQLCLVGWGSNQQWDQSALGAWGESICYEPDQVQADCSILDVRPLMVRSMADNQKWQWTHNVGGGDFFRLFNPAGRRLPHSAMFTTFSRQGPCLTEVTYSGSIGPGLRHRATVSLARSADVVRGVYRIRLDVHQPVDFSRFAVFQIGADSYSYTGERKMAVGNETGLRREWETRWGGNANRGEPIEATGEIPWVSLHEAVSRAAGDVSAKGDSVTPGAWANRGIVIRSWQARLGGRPAAPWIVEHGVHTQGTDTSTADLVPPPGITTLLPGDFVEATIEHVVVPQFPADYHGPDESLRAALGQHGNTWRMIHREATGNRRQVTVKTGKLLHTHPSVVLHADQGTAEFTLAGGLGHVPVSISGLLDPRHGTLLVDGQALDQSVHGNDFWQTDYDPVRRTWTRTYNIPAPGPATRTLRFCKIPCNQ